MGLDDFTTEESQSSSNTRNSDGGDNSSKNTKSRSEPFKTVGVGAKRKIFQSEEDWNRTVDYIDNHMGFDMDEVMSWPNNIRHKALHVGIMKSQGNKTEDFNIFRQCFVCGKEFNFPHDWDFMKYQGSVVCGSHQYEEVKKTYRQNNGEYQNG